MAVPLAHFITRGVKGVSKATVGLESQRRVSTAFAAADVDFSELSEILTASVSSITFTLDSFRMPGYDRDADPDGDGLSNREDPDDDGDLDTLGSLSTRGNHGNDRDDDDEDGDGKIDVRGRYRVSQGTLYRELSFNEGPWGSQREILKNVGLFQLTYYGDKTTTLSSGLDLGFDGLPGTLDTGENNGEISAEEMDAVLPPLGHGNGNGFLDTRNERNYITNIKLAIGCDLNGDGTVDESLTTEYAPPLLANKRKLWDP
jgi:hypothetical protein